MAKMKKITGFFAGAALFASCLSFSAFEPSFLQAADSMDDAVNGQSYSDQTGLFLSLDENGNVKYVKPERADVIEDTTLPEEKDKDVTFDVKVEIGDGEEETIVEADSMEEAQMAASMAQMSRSVMAAAEAGASDTAVQQPEVSIYTNEMLRDTSAPSVVRWINTGDTTSYTEDGTEISGYTSSYYAADAAYLGTSGNKVKFKMAGVTGWVDASKVDIIPYKDSLNLSYYGASNGRFYHYISTNINGSSSASSNLVGYQPSYIKNNTKYFSYDGHYFYTSYATMISDYKSGTYKNSVNPNKPYYNYYQYLSMRTKTTFTASDMNQRIDSVLNANYENPQASKMKNQAQSFLSAEQYGVNAALVLGLGANESAWGMSSIAQKKNNIFGLNAVDSSPGTSANTFASVEACVKDFAKNWVSKGYASPVDWRYYGPHFGDKQSGMNVKYASDPYWGEKAAAQGYYLEIATGKKDSQKYTVGIDMGSTSKTVYKEASTSSATLYRTGNDAGKVIHQFPYVILDTITNSQGTWYKIRTDGILKSDRSGLKKKDDSDGIYDYSYNYGYIKADSVSLLYNGNGTAGNDQNSGGGQDDPVTYLPGDVNGDGKVSSLDYIKIKNHIMGTKVLSGAEKERADVNGDGKITSLDYIKVKNHIMGTNKLF